MTRGLGRPTTGLDLEDIEVKPGRGNSLTCFAQNAMFDWQENISASLYGTKAKRQERREQILLLAASSYLDPLQVMAVVLIKRRQLRKTQKHEEFLNV